MLKEGGLTTTPLTYALVHTYLACSTMVCSVAHLLHNDLGTLEI